MFYKKSGSTSYFIKSKIIKKWAPSHLILHLIANEVAFGLPKVNYRIVFYLKLNLHTAGL